MKVGINILLVASCFIFATPFELNTNIPGVDIVTVKLTQSEVANCSYPYLVEFQALYGVGAPSVPGCDAPTISAAEWDNYKKGYEDDMGADYTQCNLKYVDSAPQRAKCDRVNLISLTCQCAKTKCNVNFIQRRITNSNHTNICGNLPHALCTSVLEGGLNEACNIEIAKTSDYSTSKVELQCDPKGCPLSANGLLSRRSGFAVAFAVVGCIMLWCMFY